MRVMVIDDEPIVAKALRSLIAWEELGFSWLDPADNAITALERMDRERPDLLIIDCKMPHMSGMELLTILRQRQFQMKSIFLSGFDEFQLAQQAIHLGASEYMLKPPDMDKFTETIGRLRAEWEEEQQVKRQLKDNLPMLCDRFLRSLLEGAKFTEEAFMEKCRYLELPLNTGAFVACLVSFEENPDSPRELSYEDQQLLNFSLQKTTLESLRHYKSVAMTWDSRQFLAILITGEAVYSSAFREDMHRLCAALRHSSKGLVTIGVSQIQVRLHLNGRLAHHQASTALEYKYYTGPDEVIFLGDIDWEITPGDKPAIDPALHYDKLGHALKICILDELNSWLEHFVKYLKANDFPILHAKTTGLQTLMFAYQALSEIHPKFQVHDWLTPAKITAIMSSESIYDMTDRIKEWMYEILRHTIDLRKSGKNASVEKAKQYIERHYATNITLEVLAKETCLSAVYVSFLFKQVESVTLSDYITLVRVEQAKKLLKTSSLTIYEIAEKVGYTDEKYFSRIFKKKTSFTPTEFKNIVE